MIGTAYILLGSNLGDREGILRRAIEMIECRCCRVVASSHLYESEPWGFESDDVFLNQVVCVKTTLSPHDLLNELLSIEITLGRDREHHYETYVSRPIDLDILYYDDLIIVALYILMNFEDKCKKWQERMMYVMVDEFQDVSRLNYDLAEILCDYHKNLFIVGDPDQTIYSWRGADYTNILHFERDFPGAKVIKLEQNYLSRLQLVWVVLGLLQTLLHHFIKINLQEHL